MLDFETSRQEIASLFPTVLDMARTRGGEESVRRLVAAEQRLRDGRLVAVVCGEFKRGKSTLLNALLEEPGLFPVDVDIATSMVSTISYGLDETITVALAEEDREVVKTITRSEIAGYVTERLNPRNAKRVRLVTIETPNAKLASGLTLVDTPGVGALNSEHTAVTYGFIPNADAVIFVADATTPLSAGELDFVKRISEHCDVIIYVITKIDLRHDAERVLANSRSKLSEVTGRSQQELLVVPVSGQAKIAYLESKDVEDLELSNFPAFERTLWEVLQRRRGQVHLGRALSDLGSTVDALLLPIQIELDAAEQAGREQVAKSEKKLRDKERRVDELRDNRASWRGELHERLDDLRDELDRQLELGLDRIWRRFEHEYLYDERFLTVPQSLVDQLNGDFGLLLGTIGRRAARRAGEIQQRLATATGLGLRQQRLGQLQVEQVEIRVAGGSGRRPGNGLLAIQEATDVAGTAGRIGGNIGELIGALLGGPLGALTGLIGHAIGGLLGVTVGYRRAVSTVRDQERADRQNGLRSELRPMRRIQAREAGFVIEEACRQFQRAVEEELDARITLESESLHAALARLEATRRRTTRQLAQRVEELKPPQAALEQVRAQVDGLAAELAAELGSSGPHRPAGALQ